MSAKSEHTLPELSGIKALFSALPEIREKKPDMYLVIMLGLFGGLRPQESKWLLKEKLQQHGGHWEISIEVAKDFVPKKYQERRLKIPSALGEHLIEVSRNNFLDFVLSGHMTYRTTRLYSETNRLLRENFLRDVIRPCYELRRLYASAYSVALGMDITDRRMGNKERSTTDKYNVDPDTPQKLVDLFEEAAKKLYGGPAFEK